MTTRRVLGREKELDGIAVAVEAAAAGTKRGVILLGDAGIGKSAMLDAARGVATDDGFICGAARMPEVGAPHAPMPELLADLRASCRAGNVAVPPGLHRALELMRGGHPRAEPTGLMPLVAEALEAVGTHAPVALFVDDYHRASAEGIHLLLATLRALDGPFLLVAAARPRADGASHPVPEADLWVDHVTLGGLPLDAIEALAGSVLGEVALPSLAAALMDLTQGNPLFIEELLRSWVEAGGVERTGGFWGLVNGIADEPPPTSLAEMVADRLGDLGERGTSLARTMAVLGRDVRFDELRRITGLDRDGLVDVLIRLRDARVIIEEAGPPVRYRLASALYESTLRGGMSATESAVLHQTILDALRAMPTGRGAPAAELAHHGVMSLEQPEDLPELITGAAREAELAGSLREAARWWERLGEDAGIDGVALRALEGQARATAVFDAPDAIRLFTRALDVAPDEQRVGLLVGRATAYRRMGAASESIVDLQMAFESTGEAEAFEIRRMIAVAESVRGELARAGAILSELESCAPDRASLARVSASLAGVRYASGDIAGADLASAVAVGDSAVDDRQVRGNAMWLRLVLGDWDEALEVAGALIEEGDRAGDLWNLATPLAAVARIHAWRGKNALAVDLAKRALKITRRLGNPADQIDAAEALTVALAEADQPTHAAETADLIAGIYDRGVEYRPDYPWSFAAAGEAYLAVRDPVRAQAAIDRARAQEGRVGWDVAVDRVEAGIKVHVGAPEEALALLEPWLVEPSRFPFEQARLEEAAARVLFASGHESRGLERAGRALELYRHLQVGPRIARMQDWIGRRRRRPRGRPRSTHPAGLTDREMEVLNLILHGLSNAQIAEVLYISLATAKKHVQNLLTKTNVTRRTQLLTFARDHDIKPSFGKGK